MQKKLILIFTLFFSINVFANTPEEIVGTWKLDVNKTIAKIKEVKKIDNLPKGDINSINFLANSTIFEIEKSKMTAIRQNQRETIAFKFISKKDSIVTVEAVKKVNDKIKKVAIHFHVIDKNNLFLESQELLLHLKRSNE